MIPDIIEQIKARAKRVPLLSHVTMRLMEIVADENHDQRDIIRLVETDQVLTVNVLKIANSAALCRGREVTTVNRAVSVLGEKHIIALALQASGRHVFNQSLEGYAGQRGELWRHSLRTAIAARLLAPKARFEVSPGVAYTAGLLHDIGKSVLSEFLKERPQELRRLVQEGQAPDFLLVETDLVGVNHCVAGLEVARHWHLPHVLSVAIGWHHTPALAPIQERPLAYVIHLADIVAMMTGSGTGADALHYPLDPGYPEFISLAPETLEALMIDVADEFDQTEAQLFGST